MGEKIKGAQQEVWDMARFISKATYRQIHNVFGFFGNLPAEYSGELLSKEHIKEIFNTYSVDALIECYQKYKKSIEFHRGDVVIDDGGDECVVFGKREDGKYIIVYKNGERSYLSSDVVVKTRKTIDLSAFDELEEDDE